MSVQIHMHTASKLTLKAILDTSLSFTVLTVPSNGGVRLLQLEYIGQCNLIGPLYNLQTFKLKYTDITHVPIPLDGTFKNLQL